MGLVSMCSSVAGILAPFILLLVDVWEPLPDIIFGTFSIAAAALILLLPETRGVRLPQTIEEGELFGTYVKHLLLFVNKLSLVLL